MGTTATSPSINIGSWGLRSHFDKSKGRVVGLCTETLGSESSRDEFDDISICMREGTHGTTTMKLVSVEKDQIVKEKMKEITGREFPPVMHMLMEGCDSFCNHGVAMTKDFSFMRSVRKNGRLIITEVTVEKPVILRATRKDGNLRLNRMVCHVEGINEGEKTV